MRKAGVAAMARAASSPGAGMLTADGGLSLGRREPVLQAQDLDWSLPGSDVVGSDSVGSQSVGSQSVGSQSVGSQSVGSQSVGSDVFGSSDVRSPALASVLAEPMFARPMSLAMSFRPIGMGAFVLGAGEPARGRADDRGMLAHEPR